MAFFSVHESGQLGLSGGPSTTRAGRDSNRDIRGAVADARDALPRSFRDTTRGAAHGDHVQSSLHRGACHDAARGRHRTPGPELRSCPPVTRFQLSRVSYHPSIRHPAAYEDANTQGCREFRWKICLGIVFRGQPFRTAYRCGGGIAGSGAGAGGFPAGFSDGSLRAPPLIRSVLTSTF